MKRNALTVLMAPVMVASSFGCGSSPSSATTASNETKASDETSREAKAATEGKAEGITIRMWTFLDPTSKENGRPVALQQMIDEFEVENLGVEVVVEPQDWVIMTGKFLAASVMGDVPDIMWYARDEMYGVLNAGVLKPLGNLFLGDWSVEEIADVDDTFFQFGERDGKHYTLTLNKNRTSLFYREDLLKEARLQVPETFEELCDSAKALVGTDVPGIQRYGLGMFSSMETDDVQVIINWLFQENGDLFNADGTANQANDVGVKGVNWVENCTDTDATSAENVNTTTEDIHTGFAIGKYAMAVASAVRLANLRSITSLDGNTIQFTTLPGGTVIDGWSVDVQFGSKHKEGAGKFVERTYFPEPDMKWIELDGQAPCRKSTVESLEITDENKYMEAMIKAFGEGWLPSNTETYMGWKLDLDYPVQNVLIEGIEPMAALKDAEGIFNTDNNR